SGQMRGTGDGVRPAVILDMEGLGPGQHTFTVGNGNVKVARGVKLVRAIPGEIRLSFEPGTTRDVDVRPQFIGEGKNGYQVASYTVNPPKLKVTGPADRVARVVDAETDPIDVSTAVGPSEFRVNVYLEDPYLRFVTSPQVAVNVTMKKK